MKLATLEINDFFVGLNVDPMFNAHPPACNETVEGPCTLRACRLNTVNFPYYANNPGTITISGAQLHSFQIQPDGHGFANFGPWPERADNDLLWQAGDPIRFSAPGDEVPGFDETLVGQPKLSLTAPALEPAGSPQILIDKTRPLEIAWDLPSDATVRVTLYYPDEQHWSCDFDGPARRGTIPQAVIARATETTTMQVMSRVTRSITKGDWTVNLELGALVQIGDGYSAGLRFH